MLTVLISGSILTYLSINNISNYKELTEKKISEEQKYLSEQFSLEFQKHLDETVAKFSKEAQIDALFTIEEFRKTTAISGVKFPLIAAGKGVFLWPNFSYITSNFNNQSSSKRYLEIEKLAAHSEFVENDFKKANNLYVQALKFSKNALDSVRVFNAQARLFMKIDHPKKALYLYSKIVGEYPDTFNEYGFVYAYYALNQLLELADSTNIGSIQKIIANFLENIGNGTVSSNQYTLNLLNTISKWTLKVEDDVKRKDIEALITALSNYLDVLENYKLVIDDVINDNNSTDLNKQIGGFSVLKAQSENWGERLIFKKNQNYSSGFIVDLDALFEVVNSINYSDQSKFEYNLKLIQKDKNGYSLNGNLMMESEFSSYFDNYLLQISLKNEQLVDEYVFRRKMTYGIGLFLLLGAMIMGLIVLIRDVKREKKMNRLRADFVSNVTHELKTPLTSIHMFSESILLGRVKSKNDLKKYANIIVKESENLKRMITNILEFSRQENNKLTYNVKESNLSTIVHSALGEMNYWLEISNFKVIIEVEQDVMAMVEEEGLKQALANLISNAIKYSLTKKKLFVRLIKKEKQALIEIEDCGIGIPKDKLKLIFEKFYRVNSNESVSSSGTGLGLTVTRDIIEAQNGKIVVESTLGKGSKFTIVFNI